MKTNPHFSKTILCLLVGAILGASLLGGCHPFRNKPNEWARDPDRIERYMTERVDRMLKKVDATDEQRTKAYAIRDRLMPKLVAFAQARPNTVKEALALWDQPTLDTAKLNALVDKRSDEMKALAHELVYGAGEFHAILTTEQRRKLHDAVEEHCE